MNDLKDFAIALFHAWPCNLLDKPLMTRRGFFKLLPLALAAAPIAVQAASDDVDYYIEGWEYERALESLRQRDALLYRTDPYYRKFADKIDAFEWSLAKIRAREKGFIV